MALSVRCPNYPPPLAAASSSSVVGFLPPNSLQFTPPSLGNPCCRSSHRRPLTAVNASLSAVVSPKNSSIQDEKKLLLEVKDLKAVIAESKQQILKGVNLAIYEGEVHAIMGKNGSGKSTLAKMVKTAFNLASPTLYFHHGVRLCRRFLLAIQIMKLRGVV